MRRMLMTVVLLVTTINFAVGQVNDQQSAQNHVEQEIVAASQQFADEAILNEATVIKHVSATRPKMITLIKGGEANPLKMDHIKVHIDGNKAKLTSRLVFSGRRSNGEAYEHFNKWTVELVREKGKWQVVRAQMRRADE